MLHDGDWPDILVIGEGDRYELNGMEGAYEAAAAIRQAGGPTYVPHPCSLPREGGMFAPVIYIDPTKVVVRRPCGCSPHITARPYRRQEKSSAA